MTHASLLVVAQTSGVVAPQHAFPFLTAIILAPVFAAALVGAIPKDAKRLIRSVTLAASIAVLGITGAVIDLFRSADGGYQMVSHHIWAPGLGISWSIGVDGISLFLVALTALLFPLVFFGASARRGAKSFSIWMLLLEAGCLGSFLSLDLLMFFLFFETTLIPIYFLMVNWGHEGRNRAAMKFFVYTFQER